MIRQLRLELFKLTHRGRSYLGFAALLVIAGLMVIALKMGGPPLESAFSGGFTSVGDYINGSFVAWFVLEVKFVLVFFLPLFASVISGDMISGEANDGTLRAALSKPVRRGSMFVAKFVVAVCYAWVLTFFLGLMSYGIGTIVLGRGALVTYQAGTLLGAQGVCVYSEHEGLVRLVEAYAFASVGVLSVATIAFFLSSIVSNSLSAIGGAMMAMIVCQIVGVIPYFKPVQPYLFSTHLDSWNLLFMSPVPWHDVQKSLIVLGAYVVVFFAAGLVIFKRKDILS